MRFSADRDSQQGELVTRMAADDGLCGARRHGEGPQRILMLPAFEDVELSVEAAEQMRAMLDDPTIPGAVGKEMPTVDASVLLRKGE